MAKAREDVPVVKVTHRCERVGAERARSFCGNTEIAPTLAFMGCCLGHPGRATIDVIADKGAMYGVECCHAAKCDAVAAHLCRTKPTNPRWPHRMVYIARAVPAA
jgi:hypothetical protein